MSLSPFFEAPKQRPLLIVADTGRRYPGVEILVEAVMAGYLMPFAAFFVEPKPRPSALLKIILDPKRDDCTHAGEAVAHQPEQGAVAQGDQSAGVD